MNKDTKERFDRIHRHYDFFNHLFSFGLDISWRAEAARESVMPSRSYKVLDVATGTGDFAIAISRAASSRGKTANITGMDMNGNMLAHARSKIASAGLADISVEKGDAMNMRYEDASFDVVTSAFALRNFDSVDRFAEETYRVMKKGGRFVMVDMAMPDRNAGAARAYFKVIEAVGSVVGKKAYKWLTYSIINFDKEAAAKKFRKSGFSEVKVRSLRSGIAFMITGRK